MENGQSQSSEESRKNRCKVWWGGRSKLEKYLVIAAPIISTLLIITIAVYLITGRPGLCSTPSCVTTSMVVQNYLDPNGNPCEDFYQFACGNLLKESNGQTVQQITEEKIQDQIRNMLEAPKEPIGFNLARKFYRACMNENAIEAEGLSRIKQIFERIGGWPTLAGGDWNQDNFDWAGSLNTLRQEGINFEFFFILNVEVDETTGQYGLTLKEPAYKPSTISDKIKELYLTYMIEVAHAFGASRERAKWEQNEVMDFLLDLAKICEKSRKDPTNIPKYYTIRDLQTEFHGIQWYDYIYNVLQPAGKSVEMNDRIKVNDPVYLRELIYFLHQKAGRNIANFICWHIIQHLIPFLPAKVLNHAHTYFQGINERYTREPRWVTCVNETRNRLNSVILAAYVEEYFNDNVRREAISLIRNIKDQFKQNLYKLEWLDTTEKEIAATKIMNTEEYLPSSSELLDDEVIHIYDEVEIFEDKVLKSALNLDRANTNIEYGRLGKSAKHNIVKDVSFVTGLEIDYRPKERTLNKLPPLVDKVQDDKVIIFQPCQVIPVGLFQGMYYQKDRPNYINYGALGSIIAHEISHIIMEAEDSQNQLRSLWSSRSLTKYEQQLQCIQSQYRQMAVTTFQSLNTTLTRDEDMADLAGMRVSYDTYIRWVKENGVEPQLPGLNYSANQLFWISSAIHHCTKYSSTQTSQRYIANYRSSPEQFRVNGPLQNIPEFAYDFGCPLGSKMNPQDKCLVW